MTDLSPLSPAAQAVLQAACIHHGLFNEEIVQRRRNIATALRAAADQVVPETAKPSADSDYHLMNWSKSLDQYYQRQQTRAELLAIATELENHQ